MAVSAFIIQRWKEANIVRPQTKFNKKDFNRLHNEFGDVGAEKVEPHEEEQPNVQEWKLKIDDPETRLAEQLEDDQGKASTPAPMIKVQLKPTQREWDQHLLAHTPIVPWCFFGLAARSIRRNHPKQGRAGRIAPDTGIGDGFANVSFDYM